MQILLVFVVLLAVNAPFFVTMKTYSYVDVEGIVRLQWCILPHGSLLASLQLYLGLIFYSIGPFIVMFVCSVVIIYTIAAAAIKVSNMG